jgi:hypothetical protein
LTSSGTSGFSRRSVSLVLAVWHKKPTRPQGLPFSVFLNCVYICLVGFLVWGQGGGTNTIKMWKHTMPRMALGPLISPSRASGLLMSAELKSQIPPPAQLSSLFLLNSQDWSIATAACSSARCSSVQTVHLLIRRDVLTDRYQHVGGICLHSLKTDVDSFEMYLFTRRHDVACQKILILTVHAVHTYSGDDEILCSSETISAPLPKS